jgi:hypothetical protein
MSCARSLMRKSSCVMVLMMSLEECSTLAAKSLTASATTPKPRPASPARLASTDALNATSRVCKAIWVISAAATATCPRLLVTPATPWPSCSTVCRARCTDSLLTLVTSPMARFACTISSISPAKTLNVSNCLPLIAARSSIKPFKSADSLPRPDAWCAMLLTIFSISEPDAFACISGAGLRLPNRNDISKAFFS